jgi:hypothetical protein
MGVPDPGGPVVWRRDDARPVGAECGGKHRAFMAPKDCDLISSRGVPDAGGGVPSPHEARPERRDDAQDYRKPNSF